VSTLRKEDVMTTAKTAKFPEMMAQIRAGVLRGAGVFGVGHSTLPEGQAPYVLMMGALKASTTHGQIRDSRGGYIVSMGMTKEHIEQLRDQCIALLEEGDESGTRLPGPGPALSEVTPSAGRGVVP
jgi:hypothetical protein